MNHYRRQDYFADRTLRRYDAPFIAPREPNKLMRVTKLAVLGLATGYCVFKIAGEITFFVLGVLT